MKEKLKNLWDRIFDIFVRIIILFLAVGFPLACVVGGAIGDKKKKASVKEKIAVEQQITEKQAIEKPAAEKSLTGDFDDPGCPIVPEFGPGSVAYEEAKCWPGVDPYSDVYVSKSSLTVHKSPNCSGMRYYYIMQAYEAYYYGYSRCQKCW